MLKLIAIDLDGTLLDDDKKLSQKNIRSLERLHDKGVEIVIATGRSYEATMPYINMIKDNVVEFLICNNGATVYNLFTKTILVDDILSKNQIQEIMKLVEELNDIDVHFVGDDKIYTYKNPIGKYIIEDAYISFLNIYFKTKEEIQNSRISKVLITAEEKYISLILSRIPNIYFEKYNIVVSAENYIEILNKNIDKGHALKSLINSLNIESKNVIAIGDQQNDVGMFNIVGVSYAMLEASESIKKQATYIGPSNSDSGIAKIISDIVKMEE